MCSAMDFRPFPPERPLTPDIEQLPAYSSAIRDVDFFVTGCAETDQIPSAEKILRRGKLNMMNVDRQFAAEMA